MEVKNNLCTNPIWPKQVGWVRIRKTNPKLCGTYFGYLFNTDIQLHTFSYMSPYENKNQDLWRRKISSQCHLSAESHLSNYHAPGFVNPRDLMGYKKVILVPNSEF